MASTQAYLDYVLDLLSGLSDITHRKMMGEYLLYLRGKLIGGIYDDRFLLKRTAAAERLLDEVRLELPYDGAQQMVLVDIEDREHVAELVKATYGELPKARRTRRSA